MKLAVEIGQALPDDKRVRALLVLLELDDLLLHCGNVLLPDVYVGPQIGMNPIPLWGLPDLEY